MRRLRGDEGSALVEFTLLAIVLLIPLVYVVTTVGRAQAAAYAAEAAAREAGRAFVTAPDPTAGEARARLAVRLAAADQGVPDLPPSALRIRCLDGACLAPGSAAEVTVTVRVRLPGLPAFLGGDRGVIPVTARHLAPVEAYRSER